jgi:hypothetical protein
MSLTLPHPPSVRGTSGGPRAISPLISIRNWSDEGRGRKCPTNLAFGRNNCDWSENVQCFTLSKFTLVNFKFWRNCKKFLRELYSKGRRFPKVVGSIPTVVRHIFQACPVWIYTQSNITSIIFTWVHYTNTAKSLLTHCLTLFPQNISYKNIISFLWSQKLW